MIKAGSSIKNYKILFVLRPGAGGNVYVAEDVNSHKKYVLKSSFLENSKKPEFEVLVLTWKKLSDSCEYIVEFIEFFYEDSNAFVVMEYCSGGDLQSLIAKKRAEGTKFTEYEVSKIITQTFTGMQAMHAMKLLHRDLKPGNILITGDGDHKIADFNVARVLDVSGALSYTLTGTMQYVPPEVFQNKGYSFAADAYSMGAILYEVLTLNPAFSGMDIPRILVNQYTPIDASLGYSGGLVKLVHLLLSLDPAQRPSAEAVLSDASLTRAHVHGVEQAQRTHSTVLATLQRTVEEQRATIAGQQGVIQEQQRLVSSYAEKMAAFERRIEALERTAGTPVAQQHSPPTPTAQSTSQPAPPAQQPPAQASNPKCPTCLDDWGDLWGLWGDGPSPHWGLPHNSDGHCNKCGKNFCTLCYP